MARIRTIKPDFFLHEELAELSALHRLLFIGLWTLADKDGRLEDRPKRIKAALLPWDDCDMHEMLEDLNELGLIHRYEADVGCIAIPSFSKHQRPHPKEPASSLPGPAEPWKKTASREKKRQEIKPRSSIPSSPVGREGKEVLDNGKESGEGAAGEASPEKPAAPEIVFFAWAQDERSRSYPGLIPESPNPDYPAFWARAMNRLRNDPARLREAWRCYLRDRYGAEKKPPFAMRVFQNDECWVKHVPEAVSGPLPFATRPAPRPDATPEEIPW